MAYNRNDFGNKRKQGKKSFYWAACIAIICLMAVGTVYYKTNQTAKNRQSQSDNLSAEVPQSTPAGNSAISGNYIADGNELTGITEGSEAQDQDSQAASTVIKSEKSDSSKKKNNTDKKQANEESQTSTEKETEDNSEETESSSDKSSTATMSTGTQLAFDEEAGLSWPVNGDVIMKFSQKNTVYFKTLAQYKCNPAIEISAKEGSNVKASAAGTVTDISQNEETGTMVTTSIGNDYTVVYGQLKDVKVTKGQSIKEGDVIGKVAAPTKYFSEEGSNLYFQVTQNNEAVDPLLLLK